MTCFWDGILNLLTTQEINTVFRTNYTGKTSVQDFINGLQQNNIQTPDVIHQGTSVSTKQTLENITAIQCISPGAASGGYDCSSADPVLFLISQLFNYNITHVYNNVSIYYSIPAAKGTLTFGSNTNHFWSISRT